MQHLSPGKLENSSEELMGFHQWLDNLFQAMRATGLGILARELWMVVKSVVLSIKGTQKGTIVLTKGIVGFP